MIQVQELTKQFDQYAALDQVSMTIPKGSIYGLVGTNGSGKSTLLRLISGVYLPDRGKVSLDGLPCTKPDKPVPEGGKISARGFGKVVLKEISGRTKKDRISIVLEKYV